MRRRHRLASLLWIAPLFAACWAPAPALAQESGAEPDPEEAAPWEGATDVSLPPFLQDTGKRIVDQRPAPTEQQLEALKQLEEEVERFGQTGEAFRSTVTSLVRREYLQQRRERDRWYGERLESEERELNEARESSIRVFEEFLRRYPSHPKYSPDAMFRLGELYFERSAVEFQNLYDEAQAAREAGDLTAEDQLPSSPDFTPTVLLYKSLARRFPDYERSDGVYYLIGYTLNEMGRPEEALAAWLALVCANNYDYDPDWRPPSADESLAAQAKYPALTLDGRPLGATVRGVFVNAYARCKPTSEQARFVSETWFRIGEYHFDDFGGDHALDLSIAAYGRILENSEDRNYNLALYKVAWAYYRASRYPEAIQNFGKLVQWSDDTRKKTGKAGSGTRIRLPIRSRAGPRGSSASRMPRSSRSRGPGRPRSTSSWVRSTSTKRSTPKRSRPGGWRFRSGRTITEPRRFSTKSRTLTRCTTSSKTPSSRVLS